MEDKALIEKARDGDRAAFEAIVKRYENKVFHLAYSFVQDRASADDLAQDIFVKIYVSLQKFHFKSEFGTWLYRLAVNYIKDHLRKTSRRREVSLEEVKEMSFATDDGHAQKEREEDDAERRRAVMTVLETLPPKYRMILTLRDVRGLSYGEIVRTLNLSPGTVDSRLHRARRMLLRKMAPYLSEEGGSR